MKFHFEINVSHYVKIEFQLEIDTSHYVKWNFKMKLVLYTMRKCFFGMK